MDFLTTPRVARELNWTGPLARGSRGPEVKRIQEWLCLRGLACAIDGDLGPATLRQAAAFAARERLPFDGATINLGVLGALTVPLRRAFSFECEAPSLRTAVLAVARAHAKEHPREVGGDNRGPWVRAYCGRDGVDYKWCAGCGLSIVHQACAVLDQPPIIGFTLGCDEVAELARAAHRLTHDPKSVRGGDLFLCWRRTASGLLDYFHVGIVAEMHATDMATFEGNTNDEGSANGYEFVPRARGLEKKDYVRLD